MYVHILFGVGGGIVSYRFTWLHFILALLIFTSKNYTFHPSISRLYEDTAWNPIQKEKFDSSPVFRKAIIYGYGPLRPWMSIAHWYHLMNEAYFFMISTVDLISPISCQ